MIGTVKQATDLDFSFFLPRSYATDCRLTVNERLQTAALGQNQPLILHPSEWLVSARSGRWHDIATAGSGNQPRPRIMAAIRGSPVSRCPQSLRQVRYLNDHGPGIAREYGTTRRVHQITRRISRSRQHDTRRSVHVLEHKDRTAVLAN